jgi:hypothetical protein
MVTFPDKAPFPERGFFLFSININVRCWQISLKKSAETGACASDRLF